MNEDDLDDLSDLGLTEPGSNPTESETSLVRSSAVVGVGTALSRVTGFVRIAAIAYALGVSTLAGVYSYANETPNIVYELLLGGVLTATLVPLFVKHFEDARRRRHERGLHGRDGRTRGDHHRRRDRWHRGSSTCTRSTCTARASARSRSSRRAAPAVHAADVLLRHRRARDGNAQRAPAVPRGRVRARAQQRRRRSRCSSCSRSSPTADHRSPRARRRRAPPAHRARHHRRHRR